MSYSFANRTGTFLNELGAEEIRVVVPLAGDTVTLNGNHNYIYIKPAGTIATLTIKLPPAPVPGMLIALSFGAIVTALTIQDSAGNAVTGAATAGAVGVATQLRYLPTGTWVKWS